MEGYKFGIHARKIFSDDVVELSRELNARWTASYDGEIEKLFSMFVCRGR
jgi:hypothetical protein